MSKSAADKLEAEKVRAALEKAKEGEDLSPAEIRLIERYEKKQKRDKAGVLLAEVPKRLAQRQAKRATRKPQRRRRRISLKYRPFLQRIAELYVASGGNATGTERAVRDQLGLGQFQAKYLAQWLRVPEFAMVVRVEEERTATEETTSPFVRGPKYIQFLSELRQCMQEAWEDASENSSGKPMLLQAMTRVSAELRAEEKHLADQRTARARQSLGAFLRGLLRHVKQAGEPPIVWAALTRALQNLDRIVGASTDLVDAGAVVAVLMEQLKKCGLVETAAKGKLDVAHMSDDALQAIVDGASRARGERKRSA